ncbi:uncharacterized protein LOC133197747 isoform X1 [Saccostrea echinata]|uniref:uncharacterized protein LOC133197747 isoform X1 n=1 Tax=Saccostrea echinata TaxID=191078 RepID=UPI002A81846E|nr:uncharacterized protein LOC133197747 isoform X1 [Saccostrea echinata]
MGITVEFHNDGCALIRMQNGQNRWNLTTLSQLNNALDEVERNKSASILVTTGEGKFYSNGIDLDWLNSTGRSSDAGRQFYTVLLDTLWRVMHFPIPTVAAINGHCFAGGAFLALCHDYRVMRSDRGWISWNETLISLRITDSLSEILERKLNIEALRESVIYAKRLTGPEALKLKIVDRIETESNLISESKAIGFKALGNNIIQRKDLQNMKKDMIPRTIGVSKL